MHKKNETATHQDWSLHRTIVQMQRQNATHFLAHEEHSFSLAALLMSNSSTISNEAVSKFVEDIKKLQY